MGLGEPDGFTVDAAVASMKLVPNSQDLRQLWIRWILDEKFDGRNGNIAQPNTATVALTEILSLESAKWDDLIDAFQRHIRKFCVDAR